MWAITVIALSILRYPHERATCGANVALQPATPTYRVLNPGQERCRANCSGIPAVDWAGLMRPKSGRNTHIQTIIDS